MNGPPVLAGRLLPSYALVPVLVYHVWIATGCDDSIWERGYGCEDDTQWIDHNGFSVRIGTVLARMHRQFTNILRHRREKL